MRPPHAYSSAPQRNPYEDLAALADRDEREEHSGGIGGFRGFDDLGPEDSGDPGAPGPEALDADDEPWSPPDHRRSRRRRGRFRALPFAAKAVVLVCVCSSFLIVADRWAALYAEHRAEKKLQSSLDLAAAPEVSIHGFPFLNQLFDKRLDKVDVTIPDVAADRVSLAKVSASATDVRLTGALPSSVDGALISRMQGDVLLSFDDLNRELGSSQVRFTEKGRDSVLAVGKLPVAGHELRVRAEAHIRRVGGRGIDTDITGMRLDISDLATYTPGEGDDAGLRLSRKAADRISKDAAQAKALLTVPSLAERLGVPRENVEKTLRSEERLSRVTGAPRFVDQAMRLNLVDAVTAHPALLQRLGIDAALADGLTKLTQPRLADKLALSFQLPDVPGYVRLRDIAVEPEGIRVGLSGMDIPFGNERKKT